LIIINDGSSDRTADIISEFKDNRIRFVNHSENKGVMLRSKEAIDLSVGEYIAIHDADDVSMSNRLELQVKFLDSNPEIFCVGGRAKKIDVGGKLIGEWDFPPLTHKDIVALLVIYGKCPMINPTTMYRKHEYYQLSGYSPDNSMKSAHDLDFWCRAIVGGKKFANITDYLIKYRVNPDGMTRKNKIAQVSDHMKIMNDLRKRMKDVKF